MNLYRRQHQRQRGISLLFTAIFMMLVALAAMALLYWMRFGKVPGQEVLDGIGKQGVAAIVVQNKLQAAAGGQSGSAAEIRRCVIAGKVTYSNVDCRPEDGRSVKVQLHDTQGFEAPKVPVAAASDAAEGSVDLREKMIDKAVAKGK